MAETALLIVDMQVWFTSRVETECLPNVLQLSQYFYAYKDLQIFTKHGHSAAELSGEVPNQLVRKGAALGAIPNGSPDWRLMPEILNAMQKAGGLLLEGKNTYDAFLNTDLEKILRERAIKRVIVCGMIGDGSCDTTARSAFNRGFDTWLVRDACGSVDKTQHENALAAYRLRYGEVYSTDQVLMLMRAFKAESLLAAAEIKGSSSKIAR